MIFILANGEVPDVMLGDPIFFACRGARDHSLFLNNEEILFIYPSQWKDVLIWNG